MRGHARGSLSEANTIKRVLPGQKVPHRSVKLSAYFAASGELVDIGETITKSKMHDFEFFSNVHGKLQTLDH